MKKSDLPIQNYDIEHNSVYELRSAELNDTKAIRTMHAQSWLDTYPNEEFGISEEWVKERVSHWTTPKGLKESEEHFSSIFNNPEHFFRVATAGHNIIGFVHASNIGNEQELKALYVDKDQKGSGLAQELMKEVNDWLDKNKSVKLGVAVYNERAINFYTKQGFEKTPNSEQLFANKIPMMTMERKSK